MTAYHLMSRNTSFTPPPGADDVQCPRSSKEFISTLLCVFLPTAAIYGHLLHLRSGKRPKRPDILKFCAFLFLPALPLVQLVNNFSKACDGRWKDVDLPYYASAVLGMRASTEQIEGISDDHTVHLYDVPPQLAQREETDRHGYFRAIHVLLAVILALPVTFDFVIYAKRYGEGVEGYANTAALGLDHRFGWMDLGSMFATLSTIIIILVLNHQWKVDVQPDRDEYENDMKRIKISVENRLYDILREACLAAAIQDVANCLHHQLSPIYFLQELVGPNITIAIIVGILTVTVLREYNVHRDRRLGIDARGISDKLEMLAMVVYVVAVVVLQGYSNIRELVEVQKGHYHPWNFGWRQPNRLWE